MKWWIIQQSILQHYTGLVRSHFMALMSIYCYLWLAAKSNAGDKWYINLSLCMP